MGIVHLRTRAWLVAASFLVVAGCTGAPTAGDSPSSGAPSKSVESAAPGHLPGVVDPDNVTLQDLALLHAECLREKGWEVTLDLELGAYESPDLTEEQYGIWAEDRETCEEKYAHLLDAPLVDPNDPRWESYYQDQLDTAECLRQQGYEVDPPPSLEVWKEHYIASSDDLWLAYGAVSGSVDETEWRALNRVCPQP
ncbi:MAG: hypothetical protein R2722_10955 [Tessaracoccus sp.]